MPSEVIVRLGSHAEKDYLVKTMGLFSGAVVGANLLEATPGATVSLAWKFDKEKKRFLIDPMTYVFAIDLDFISSETTDRKTGRTKKGLKKSFKKICEKFGDPYESVVLKNNRSIAPANIAKGTAIDEMCQAVFNYQWTRMKEICENDPQLQEFSEHATPSAVFSPYFYIPAENTIRSQQWEDVCIRLIESFGSLESTVPKYAVLCIDRRLLLDLGRIRNLLNRVIESGCDACWLWINAFREESISEPEINNLDLLVKQADTRGFPLWNMHGGFLSCILNKHGMAGFSHGIGYGESKDVLPVSGGAVPTVAYHYNPLHVRASVLDIILAFSSVGVTDAKSFHEIVCNCTICKGVLKGNIRNFEKFGEAILKPGNERKTQTSEAGKLCRFHFLLARKIELDLVNSSSIDDLKKLFRGTVLEYEALSPQIALRSKAAGLKMWMKCL